MSSTDKSAVLRIPEPIAAGRPLDAMIGVESGLFSWVLVRAPGEDLLPEEEGPLKMLAPTSPGRIKEIFDLTSLRAAPEDARPAPDWDFFVDHFSTGDAAAMRLIRHLVSMGISTSVEWTGTSKQSTAEVVMSRSVGTRRVPCGYGTGSFPFAVALAAAVTLVGSQKIRSRLLHYPQAAGRPGLGSPGFVPFAPRETKKSGKAWERKKA